MTPTDTVDPVLAAFELLRDVLLPSGAITEDQATTIGVALIYLLDERYELRESILRTEAAMIKAMRAQADRDPRPDGEPSDAG